MSGWRTRPLADLLGEHGLAGAVERPFRTDGWSGATFSQLMSSAGERFILKRDGLSHDWIARATHDDQLREATVVERILAGAGSAVRLSPRPFPYLGVAADGDDSVILMRDLSAELLAWERPADESRLDREVVDRVIAAIAGLHMLDWSRFLPDVKTVPWTPLVERLLLLSRPAATGYAADGNPVGERFLAGWDAFDRLATPEARALVADLAVEPTQLVAALGSLPSVALHGDLKLSNVAVFPDGTVGFIDLQMVIRAPVAVELGWMLVSNSAVLPIGPDDVLTRYRETVDEASAWPGFGGGPGHLTPAQAIGDWEAQVDLSWIVGLLLRGWRKGLDAEAGAILASGVSAADDLALWCERAVAAAGRRLG